MARSKSTQPTPRIARTIPARAIPPTNANIPLATYGDQAGEGDIRNPLHYMPLPRRSGAQVKDLGSTGVSKASLEQIPYKLRQSESSFGSDDDAESYTEY